MLKIVCLTLVACLVAVPLMLWAEEGFTVSGEIVFEKSGNIYLQLATKEQFERDKKGAARQLITVGEDEQKAGKVSFRLENVPVGTYAIMAFQDVNNDRTLNSGAFGPKEPWGNYQQHRPKFSGPKFEKMAFEVKKNTTGIVMTLK